MNNNFRFFDSRQKYLLFVTTTNEKNIIAEKISTQIKKIKPKKPSLNILDAGLGDGTLLMSVLRISYHPLSCVWQGNQHGRCAFKYRKITRSICGTP